MQFAQSSMFHFLWCLFLLAAFLYWAHKRHQRYRQSFVESHLEKDVAPGFAAKTKKWKAIFVLGVLFFCILALSRPQWGFEWQEVKRQGIDILVVVDTSKSMLTQDVKPNRLERTKLAVKDLLKKLRGDRIGLIAFAGEAFLLCPLTVDYNGFLLSLNDLNVNSVPRGGTNIGKAIDEAMSGYEDVPTKFKSIIIVTDGDNLEGDPLAVTKKAKEEGIKIYTIGIGTKEGELIQVKGAGGKSEFLKDSQGNFVKSRLNEKLLQQIALTTGGIYVKASGARFGLDLIYEQELSKLEKREIESKMEKRYFERFQIPLAFAFMLLFVDTCLSARRKKE